MLKNGKYSRPVQKIGTASRMCRNLRHRPPSDCLMSATEKEILEYLRLGLSLWGASICTDRSIIEVEDWISGARRGHEEFARQARQLLNASKPQSSTLTGQCRLGYRARHGIGLQNGNGAGNGNGHAGILRIEDL
jgi:hypothetical protein